MQGVWIGNRQIRLNWAEYRKDAVTRDLIERDFNQTINQTESHITTVYLGNINPNTSDQELWNIMAVYGKIVSWSLLPGRCIAFFKFETHSSAAYAICGIDGSLIREHSLRASWGKEKINREGW
jgi:nucleolysin TIA-1/TIAR